ncbi:MAG: multidrug ABC transporter ATP-binding protein, partial [Thermoproteota archaeon]
QNLLNLLAGIQDCKIDFNSGTNITIYSNKSELVLMEVLQLLNKNNVIIEDLSAMPTNLEEIFIKAVNDSNASSA